MALVDPPPPLIPPPLNIKLPPVRPWVHWAIAVGYLILGIAGILYIGINSGPSMYHIFPVLWVCSGIYLIYTLLRGYRWLPLETTACEGDERHYLVYVNDYEKRALSIIARHTGKPPKCHGIDSYPPSSPRSPPPAKRQKRSDETPQHDIELASDTHDGGPRIRDKDALERITADSFEQSNPVEWENFENSHYWQTGYGRKLYT